MHVGADDRRHDGLAAEVDPACGGGRRNLAPPADPRDHAALDQERRALDRRTAIAGNDPRAFEQHRLSMRRLRGERG